MGTFPGASGTVARDMNNRGEIVGEASDGIGSSNMHAFIWSKQDGLRSLGIVGPVPSGAGARAINNRGNVVGVRVVSAPPHPGGQDSRGWYWSPKDGMIELLPPGAIRSVALGINNRDEVVGVFVTAGPPEVVHGYLWTQATGFTVLPELAPDVTQALDINSAGDIVGFSRVGGVPHAVLWTRGKN